MRLYLDDIRPTPDGFDLRAYCAAEAINMLKHNAVTFISFDHDLGPKHMGTGHDVALWIERRADEGDMPPQYTVHSANPVGKQNIIATMKSANRIWSRNRFNR